MSGEERTAEAELVARCRRGDVGAFEELYRQHATRLYNLAFRMAGNPADADDLLQEIFLLAYRKLESFRGASALGTWLYRLGMNVCLDRLRSKANKQEATTDALEEQVISAPISAGAQPFNRLDLERAIRTLPEGARAAFLLHDVEGLDHAEVGQVLGISEGTSKSQVHKARMRIRAYLRQPMPTSASGPSPSSSPAPRRGSAASS